MKHTIYLIAIITLFNSCKQNVTNEAATEVTTEITPKNLTLIFKEYSEGDYPHFLFEDKNSKEEFDFRFLSDNNLGNLPILLDDADASFGLKANPKFIGKVFNVNIFKKATEYIRDDNDRPYTREYNYITVGKRSRDFILRT